MSALSTPLSKQHLTWQKVRTWHPCASSLRPRRLSSDPAASQACLQTSTGFGTGAEPRRSEAEQPGIMWLIVLASFLQCVSSYQVDLKKLDGLAKARVEVTQCFMWKRLSSFLFIFTAKMRSWTPVCFLPSIIVWINGFECLTCLCMTDARLPLHMHSHFTRYKMKTT